MNRQFNAIKKKKKKKHQCKIYYGFKTCHVTFLYSLD